jgi:hypothetical protein
VSLDHEYRPDPKTARCLDCPPTLKGTARCLWCGHRRGEHTGRVDPVVKLHLSRPDPNAGHGLIPKDARVSTVKWSTSACGMFHCACKRYET